MFSFLILVKSAAHTGLVIYIFKKMFLRHWTLVGDLFSLLPIVFRPTNWYLFIPSRLFPISKNPVRAKVKYAFFNRCLRNWRYRTHINNIINLYDLWIGNKTLWSDIIFIYNSFYGLYSTLTCTRGGSLQSALVYYLASHTYLAPVFAQSTRISIAWLVK